MRETKDNGVYKRIDELAIEYSTTEDTTQKTKCFNELLTLFYLDIFPRKTENMKSWLKDDVKDMCSDLFFELLTKYDKEKNDSFSAYFNRMFKLRAVNVYNKYNISHSNYEITNPKDYNENDDDRIDLIASSDEGVDRKVEEKEMLLFLTVVEIMLLNRSMYRDKKEAKERKTKSKWEYFYNFHTDMVVGYIKDLTSIKQLIDNNNRIMDSIEYDFLDYIMTQKCVDVLDIHKKACKFELSKNTSKFIRLPQTVYVDYMNIDKGSVSKMVSKYRAYLNENINRDNFI